MKKTILLFALLLAFTNVKAQLGEEHAVYSTTEFILGNYLGINLNLNYVYQEKYSVQAGYSGNVRLSRSRPEDYHSGIGGLISLGLSNPYDVLENYQVNLGKIYPLNNNGTIRLNLLAGVGLTTIREPANWEPFTAVLGSNYTFAYEKYRTLSLIINPKIEFPLTRFFGLTVSPLIQLSKNRSFYGIGFGDMLGLLRKKNGKK